MWAVILHPISRFVAALVIMLVVFGARMYHSLSAFDYPARPDGNNGQITIDFGGQYLLGALLLEGHGREMYHKRHQWATAWKSYPLASEDPNAEKHDAQELVASFMGSDHPEWSKVGGIVWAPFAAHDPFTRAVLAHEAGPLLTPELLEKINSVTPDHGLGGSLYPPLQGFVTAPLAKLGPHRAYRVTQWLMGVLGVLGGVAVSALSRGKIWWPVAASMILVYPGTRGAVDLGQNSTLTLFILLTGWTVMSRGRPIRGGMVLGLLAYKPVWALSFSIALFILGRYRSLAAMVATGVCLGLATLPFVGIQTWLDWLKVGKMAASLYDIDSNWVPLSRDLLGIPRRLLLDFTSSYDVRENPVAFLCSWLLWLLVLELTLRFYRMRANRDPGFVGAEPGFVMLGAWACSYHFMYYDALISAFGLFIILADREVHFRRRPVFETRDGRTTVWRANSWILTCAFLLVMVENILSYLRLEATFRVARFAHEVTRADGSTELPRVLVATDVYYPWDTFAALLVWAWAGWRTVRGRESP